MAKGFEKYQERVAALNRFAKELVRRSGSRCELCAAANTSLAIYEITPVPNVPDFDRCLFLCQTCRQQLDNPNQMDPRHWNTLRILVWSEFPAVQAAAYRLLKRLRDTEAWARETLDEAYVDDAVIAVAEAER